MKYIVHETQKDADGNVGVIPPAIADDFFQADNIYHTRLAYAAVSAVALHSVTMLTDEGQYVKSQLYNHGGDDIDQRP